MELLEVPARCLDDHIVERRLEGGAAACRLISFATSSSVVANGQLGGNARDRKAGGLRCQRPKNERRAGSSQRYASRPFADARRTATFEPPVSTTDGANATQGPVTHALVLTIRQCHGRSYGDTVAGVHPHGIDVLDGTDNDGVVA